MDELNQNSVFYFQNTNKTLLCKIVFYIFMKLKHKNDKLFLYNIVKQ